MLFFRSAFVLLFLINGGLLAQSQSTSSWPMVEQETRPWTRWWWHGSAVTKAGLTAEMEAYKKAGLGGLEITPIYGVYGTEKQFVNYLTPEWIELLKHTFKEAARLDMGIDMATGTGWPFGGPWVSDADACKNIVFKTYEVSGGASLKDSIFFIQQPLLRAVGNQIYEVNEAPSGEIAKGTVVKPLATAKKKTTIDQLVDPIAGNKNMQALALDQVRFEKPLVLQTLMAYSDAGNTVELTNKINKKGLLEWTAPAGHWKLYAVFSGSHGKMVERAGPGGEGNVIDHFSAQALKNYLEYFNRAFKGQDLSSLRAFFNDSYEVDDAQGAADWTPALFEEFKERRGYDLKAHLPALFAQDDKEKNSRVLCDYRETISELVLENFTRQWKAWAHEKNAIVRNQAHGSPANILDLYATVDIPEIEGIEPLRIKMASSAGNVTGKKLVSSESATWLNEHFESNLSDIKIALDRFMLNGINHIFYHGTSYSPPGEPWPGWLFYAAVHVNPRNSLWPHFSALNKYIERSQSLLQNSRPDNDVLLYYPIYDRFSTPGDELIEHFDGVGSQFDNTAFKNAAEIMLRQGYAYDYISDKQLGKTGVSEGNLTTEGKASYQTIVLPRCQFIPLKTFEKIMGMAERGATIIAFDGPPISMSGYGNLEINKKSFDQLVAKLKGVNFENGIKTVDFGKGRVLLGNDLVKLLDYAKVRKETFVNNGMQFIRKSTSDGRPLYFISNGKTPFEGWVAMQAKGEASVLYNPMSGTIGIGKTRRSSDGNLEVFVQLTSNETVFIEVHPKIPAGDVVVYPKSIGNPLPLEGTWRVSFTAGGPQLPKTVVSSSLESWSTLDDPAYRNFSGSATYTLNFQKPGQKAAGWHLDLGEVRESAEVIVNGKSMGVLLGPTFKVYLEDSALKKDNILEVKVCNLMANRIAYMDREQIFWKKFYNVNFPSRKSENRKDGIFTAAQWKPRPSGLLGPVQLTPVSFIE